MSNLGMKEQNISPMHSFSSVFSITSEEFFTRNRRMYASCSIICKDHRSTPFSAALHISSGPDGPSNILFKYQGIGRAIAKVFQPKSKIFSGLICLRALTPNAFVRSQRERVKSETSRCARESTRDADSRASTYFAPKSPPIETNVAWILIWTAW